MAIEVGAEVQWTKRLKEWNGFSLELREGTVVTLDGEVAVIKPPNKYAARVRVPVSKLTAKASVITGTAG